MPRSLFEDLMPRGGGRTWRAVPLSLAVHGLAALAAGLLLVRPTLSAEEEPERGPVTWAPERPAPVPVAAAPAAPTRSRRSAPVEPPPRSQAGPPPTALPIDPAPIATSVTGAFDASPSVCLAGCGNGPADAGGHGPGDPSLAGGDAQGNGGRPLPIGGDLRPPRKVRHVVPPYPELARRAGVGGTVVVQCVIDVDGRVSEARVLRGHPLLDAAALEAVREWRYEPTRLNGIAVPVVMTVSVTFVAQR